jgi:very-short-patch-repair endonuclease
VCTSHITARQSHGAGLVGTRSSVIRVVDNRYPDCSLIVELDGQKGHTGDGVFRDIWRDNSALLQGEQTLRLG